MNLEKMHPALKEQFCEQLYETYIIGASDCLLKYEEYATTIHAKMPISCYTNFRDAIFHFRKVVFVVEENEIERQAFAVKEHLSRSLTDAANAILHHLSSVAEELLKDVEISGELKHGIRKSLHLLKKAVLQKRFRGMMISNDDISNISHEEIQSLIDEFYDFLNMECYEKFAKYSSNSYPIEE